MTTAFEQYLIQKKNKEALAESERRRREEEAETRRKELHQRLARITAKIEPFLEEEKQAIQAHGWEGDVEKIDTSDTVLTYRLWVKRPHIDTTKIGLVVRVDQVGQVNVEASRFVPGQGPMKIDADLRAVAVPGDSGLLLPWLRESLVAVLAVLDKTPLRGAL